MKRVLIVSYWHPPAVGAAAERVFAWSRHLPEFGWTPLTLTAGQQPRGDARWPLLVPDPLAERSPLIADYTWPQSSSRRRLLPGGWLFPDRFTWWRRRAESAVARQLENDPPDAVIASFPPASAAQLGMRLAERFNRPLIVDLRDLWLGDGGHNPPTRWHRQAHERLQTGVLARAARISVVSDTMRDEVAQHTGRSSVDFLTLPNGYDPTLADMPHAPHHKPVDAERQHGKTFTLAHVGTVVARNRPELFFAAVQPRASELAAAGLRIRFVGNLASHTAGAFGGLISTTGLVPREQAWLEMKQADALLLLVGDYVGRWGNNAKLFEYIHAGKPILCLEETAGSNDRRVLESLDRDRCVFANLNKPESILEALQRIQGKTTDDVSQKRAQLQGLSVYSRQAQTQRLAALLDDVVRDRR